MYVPSARAGSDAETTAPCRVGGETATLEPSAAVTVRESPSGRGASLNVSTTAGGDTGSDDPSAGVDDRSSV